jgi:hypothetical protein
MNCLIDYQIIDLANVIRHCPSPLLYRQLDNAFDSLSLVNYNALSVKFTLGSFRLAYGREGN